MPMEGWILTYESVEEKPDYCLKCKKRIITPFFFCPDLKKSFCYECESSKGRNGCLIITKKEHEHFKIIRIKSNDIRPMAERSISL
jgi:hypothetical protein